MCHATKVSGMSEMPPIATSAPVGGTVSAKVLVDALIGALTALAAPLYAEAAPGYRWGVHGASGVALAGRPTGVSTEHQQYGLRVSLYGST